MSNTFSYQYGQIHGKETSGGVKGQGFFDESMLSRILDYSINGVFVFNVLSKTVFYINRRFSDLTGYMIHDLAQRIAFQVSPGIGQVFLSSVSFENKTW